MASSKTGTWFQGPEAYSFYESLPDLFQPFVFAVKSEGLRAVCVGYVTVEKNAVRQFFTRRAIILGGPCFSDDCINEEVSLLLSTLRQQLSTGANAPIYIESRNFNDYSKWKDAFAAAEFDYRPHLNFHVDPATNNLSDNRCRQIRRACEAGATTMIIEKMSAVEPLNDEAQIREWYEVLAELYRTKVKTPLWPVEFFLEAYRQGVGKFLLVKYEGNVIGGNMVVTDGKTVYEWFECGRNAEYKEQYPSVMATWAGIQWAKETGCARYDMMGAGEPGVPYGVRDFKSEFGGEMVEHGRFLCVNKPMLYRIGALAVRILRKLK